MKLKIPPAIQVLFCGFIMWLIKKFTSQEHFNFEYQNEMSLILLLIGVILGILAIYSFRKAQTTVDPLSPEKATSLVKSGIYKYSRNPMYLALLFVLLAFLVRLGNLYNLIVIVLYIVFITEFQIKPEEKALTSLFGKHYLKYKMEVRRWI
ncbi:MAG: isoprenylcysteine carboxylmethyltransferase family protein [Flavobacteriaceae bacterium]|nr:isoprenylcysteine carboxylmethyltransferase family protein [Flavobacteriaceae bacterium]